VQLSSKLRGKFDDEEIGSNGFDQGSSEDLGVALKCFMPPDAYRIKVPGSRSTSLPKLSAKMHLRNVRNPSPTSKTRLRPVHDSMSIIWFEKFA